MITHQEVVGDINMFSVREIVRFGDIATFESELKFFTYSLALNSLAFRFECSSVDDPVFEASIKDLLSVVASGLFETGAFPEVLLWLF